MLKKDIFLEHEKFKNNRKGYPEDYELWLKILSNYNAGNLQKSLTTYQDSPKTSVRKYSKPWYLQFILILFSQTIFSLKNFKFKNLLHLYINFFLRFYYILKKYF